MMLKAFAKIHVPKGLEIVKGVQKSGTIDVINYQFSSEKPKETTSSRSTCSSYKHKEAFQNLKSQINSGKNQDSLRKYAIGTSFEGIKQKLYENFKLSKDQQKKSAEAKNIDQASMQAPYESVKSTLEQKKAEKSMVEELSGSEKNTVNETAKQESTLKAKLNIKESLASMTTMAPILGKMAGYIKDSWDQTFPKDKFQMKSESVKKKARELAEKQRQEHVEYTEEELEKLQGTIPQWKRTALMEVDESIQERQTMRKRMTSAVKNRFNETDVAKQLYQSEQFKEYQEVRKEILQFKEDLKDHLSQSQNPAVMGSMALYSTVTSESNTARAIKEMRKRVPGFDVFELEMDARGVFCQIYDAFLEGNLDFIRSTCGESALVYFKTLLKKREVDNVHPQYTYLWDSEQADIIGGRISAESSQPCFTFTIQVQEIYCNISNKTKKIVDGGEDRVLRTRYNFVLTLHEDPDLEMSGHPWELIEVQPIENVKMLA